MTERVVHKFDSENGLEVRVRPLSSDDASCLLDIFDHMSADSRYLRFNQPVNSSDRAWLRAQAQQMAEQTAATGRGWIAFAELPDEGMTPVGGIRFIFLSREIAEVSLVVRDDYQNLGIGTNLLQFAGLEAYALGVSKLIGVVHSTNVALWYSLKRLNVAADYHRDGSTIFIEVALDENGLQSTAGLATNPTPG